MESSNAFGDAEECHSSESGWTMYICSPTPSDNNDDGDSDDDGNNDNTDDYVNRIVKPEDESDDSMASDAGSGPSHRENSWESGKGGSDTSHCEDQVDKNDTKLCLESHKRAKNPVKKMNEYERRKLKKEKEESVIAAKGAKVASQSSDKVKKNSSWFGKRK